MYIVKSLSQKQSNVSDSSGTAQVNTNLNNDQTHNNNSFTEKSLEIKTSVVSNKKKKGVSRS